jgi:hypothetical protein
VRGKPLEDDGSPIESRSTSPIHEGGYDCDEIHFAVPIVSVCLSAFLFILVLPCDAAVQRKAITMYHSDWGSTPRRPQDRTAGQWLRRNSQISGPIKVELSQLTNQKKEKLWH